MLKAFHVVTFHVVVFHVINFHVVACHLGIFHVKAFYVVAFLESICRPFGVIILIMQYICDFHIMFLSSNLNNIEHYIYMSNM